MDVPGIALITGAASGIGRACAKAFAREGAAGIALLDLNEESLKAVADEIRATVAQRKNKCGIVTHVLDVSKEEDVDKVLKDVAKHFGRIDYVVNAAGIAKKHAGGAAFVKTDDWKRVIDVNLNGTFFVLRAAAAIMLEQEPILSSKSRSPVLACVLTSRKCYKSFCINVPAKVFHVPGIDGRPLQRGSIVNFSSILGIVGVTLSTAYTAAKHAVTGLTRSASCDYAKDGLRINCICPGYTETPMTINDPVVLKVMQEKVAGEVPMSRMGRPEELADGVLYLAGGRSSFVTGSALMVDGGYTSH